MSRRGRIWLEGFAAGVLNGLCLALLAAILQGCGPSTRPSAFAAGPQAVTTRIPTGAGSGGAMVVHYDAAMTGEEILRAAEACSAHWREAGNLAHPTSVYLGALWPAPGLYHVWIHKARTLGDPYAPAPVLGELRRDGAHLVLGDCAEVPDFTHQLVHAMFAPREAHDYSPFYFQRVLDQQAQTVALLKLRRGCP